VGSAFGVSAFLLVAAMVDRGQPVDRRLLTAVAVVAVLNGIAVLPALRIVRWAVPADPMVTGYVT
jgi:hypothetical protein